MFQARSKWEFVAKCEAPERLRQDRHRRMILDRRPAPTSHISTTTWYNVVERYVDPKQTLPSNLRVQQTPHVPYIRRSHLRGQATRRFHG